MAYESPVEIVKADYNRIVDDIGKAMDDYIMMEIETKIGVEVNKEELIKALNYDRDQYNKGYKEGYEKEYNESIEVINRLHSVIDEILSLCKGKLLVYAYDIKAIYDKHLKEYTDGVV